MKAHEGPLRTRSHQSLHPIIDKTGTRTMNAASTNADYVVLTHAPTEHAFVLHKLSPVDDFFEVVDGDPRAHDFPSDVTHTVSADYPHNIALDDVLRSPQLVFLISPRLKAFLEERKVKQVEFLPVTILDHKKKPAGHYFILSPIHPLNCLDEAASGAKPNPMAPSQVHEIQQIVLKPGSVDPELEIFKIDRMSQHVMVSRSLAQAIDAAGFTGLSWTEFRDFHRS
jgi:hypothetical protein